MPKKVALVFKIIIILLINGDHVIMQDNKMLDALLMKIVTKKLIGFVQVFSLKKDR